MALDIYAFSATIPPGTTIAAPFKLQLPMPPRIVQAVEIKVPAGPRGNMGFALGASGVAVIPFTPGSWIITDNEEISWPLENQISSGGWQFFGYNLGTYAHTVYLRFLCTLPSVAPPSMVALLDSTQIDGSGGTSTPTVPPDVPPPLTPPPDAPPPIVPPPDPTPPPAGTPPPSATPPGGGTPAGLVGAGVIGGMAAMRQVDATLGVYVQGAEGRLLQWWDSAGAWYGPIDVTGTYLAPQLALGALIGAAPGDAGDDVTVAFRAVADGKVYAAWRVGGVWAGPLQLPNQ